MSNRVSLDEQRRAGLVRQQYPANYVPAERSTRLDALPPHETHMAVTHPATQQVVVTTNAVDRSKGFQIAITPMAVVLAILAVIVSLAFESDLLSFASILIFWATFTVVYVAGWAMTALATPEAVSFYSAKQQWDVIKAEQRERWAHYRRQTGHVDPPEQPSEFARDLRFAVLIGFAVGIPVALAILIGGAW